MVPCVPSNQLSWLIDRLMTRLMPPCTCYFHLVFDACRNRLPRTCRPLIILHPPLPPSIETEAVPWADGLRAAFCFWAWKAPVSIDMETEIVNSPSADLTSNAPLLSSRDSTQSTLPSHSTYLPPNTLKPQAAKAPAAPSPCRASARGKREGHLQDPVEPTEHHLRTRVSCQGPWARRAPRWSSGTCSPRRCVQSAGRREHTERLADCDGCGLRARPSRPFVCRAVCLLLTRNQHATHCMSHPLPYTAPQLQKQSRPAQAHHRGPVLPHPRRPREPHGGRRPNQHTRAAAQGHQGRRPREPRFDAPPHARGQRPHQPRPPHPRHTHGRGRRWCPG